MLARHPQAEPCLWRHHIQSNATRLSMMKGSSETRTLYPFNTPTLKLKLNIPGIHGDQKVPRKPHHHRLLLFLMPYPPSFTFQRTLDSVVRHFCTLLSAQFRLGESPILAHSRCLSLLCPWATKYGGRKSSPVSWDQCHLMLSSSRWDSLIFSMLLFFSMNYLWTFTNCGPRSASLLSNTQPCHQPWPLKQWPVFPPYYDKP